MPSIVAVGSALPEHHYRQDEVSKFELALGGEAIFRNALVDDRYFIKPIEEILRLGSFAERNQIFEKDGYALAEKAARDAMARAEVEPRDIDGLVFVSTTGFAVPGLDVLLAGRLGFSASLRRWPVFGWGCTGGVSGLAQAFTYAKAEPKARVLVVALELCSLAYQQKDATPKAMIASAIFNDGAAAVLVQGDEVKRQGRAQLPSILNAHSHLFPETTDLMGWEQVETGLQVILSPKIPELVAVESRGFVHELMKGRKEHVSELPQILSHTGGARILSALQEALGLKREQMEISWETLRRYGNMSSVSVLLALQEALRRGFPAGSVSPLLAFGPGFSAEGLLIQW